MQDKKVFTDCRLVRGRRPWASEFLRLSSTDFSELIYFARFCRLGALQLDYRNPYSLPQMIIKEVIFIVRGVGAYRLARACKTD